MNSVLTRVLYVMLLISGATPAGEGFPIYPEDPFGTHDDVSTTPGRAATQVGNDPCIPRGVHGERWTLVDVIDQALCHNPQTRQAWANAKQQASQFGSAESAYLPSLTFNMPISRSQNTAGGGISNGVPVNGGEGRKIRSTPASSPN